MGTVLRIYERLLQKYPLITSSVQTGILMATGDVIAQTTIEGTSLKDINFVRTSQFGTVGLFVAGPALTTWYKFLAKQFGNSGKTVVFKKTSLGVVQGKDLNENIKEIKKHYPDILCNNYKLWPWVQLGNFYLVPLRFQVLAVQIVAIAWNTYLSWKTQAKSINVNKVEILKD